MDRKSIKKIGWILVIWILFLSLFTGGFFLYVEKETKIREKQLSEITVIYPEVEQELRENFEYYNRKETEAAIQLFVFAAVFGSLFLGIIYLVSDRKSHKERKKVIEETNGIYEQLKRFQKGDFQMYFREDELEGEDEWSRIYELLGRLAFSFDSLKQQLAKEENSTKALITDISHQLKTPLASLRMSYELTRTESLTEEERKEFLDKEEREINKLEYLLNELVNLSRLESDMIQVRPVKASILKTVTEALNQVFMKAHNKKIELTVNAEEKVKDMDIRHDPKWTAEALSNILDNAVKYSPPQTHITIRLSCLPSSLLIEIEDQGMGIPEKEIHMIYKRFYRGEQAREKVKEGAGVGLYLSRSIIEQQGGTVVAKSSKGAGTVFKIVLPLITREKAPS